MGNTLRTLSLVTNPVVKKNNVLLKKNICSIYLMKHVNSDITA